MNDTPTSVTHRTENRPIPQKAPDSHAEQQDDANENRKLPLPLLVYVYFLAVGVSYHWGFWLPFEINVLEFTDITDIIKAAAYPLLPAAALLFFYAAVDGFNTATPDEIHRYNAMGGFPAWFLRFKTLFNLAVIVAATLLAAYLLLTEPGYQKLKGVFPLASFAAFMYSIHNDYLIRLHVQYRVALLLAICFLPTVAFRTGNEAGEALRYPDGSYWKLKTKEACPGTAGDLVFLHRLGNKYLTMSAVDKSLCIVPDTSVQLIRVVMPSDSATTSTTTSNHSPSKH